MKRAAALAVLMVAVAAGAETERLTVRDGGFVTTSGRAVGLYGVNLYQSHMMWARRQRADEAREAIRAIAAYGLNAVRLPLSAAYLAPTPTILAGDPGYAEVMRRYKLKTGYLGLLDELLDEAAKRGVQVIAELHELPGDEYRWFSGGEESLRGSGQPGGGIAWMNRPELVREHLPRILGRLAEHWRHQPALCGLEVPYNEPHEPWPFVRGAAYRDFVADCAKAIKAADPRCLVFMHVGDWGAGVNELSDSWVWDLPAEVDALTPHFYLGMHNASARIADAYGVVPASWLSWFRGSGRPVVIGEWGPAHAAYPRWQKYDSSDQVIARLHEACPAGWWQNGAQGAFRWAWDAGLDDPQHRGGIEPKSLPLLKWSAPFAQRPRQGRGAVAVVLAPQRRSQYGQPTDLMRIAAALLDLGATPFDTLFDRQVTAQPAVLKPYRALLVYRPDLAPAALTAVARAGIPTFELADDAVPRERLRDFLTGCRIACERVSVPIWAVETPGRVALYNRTGENAAYTAPLAGAGRVADRLSGELLPLTTGAARFEVPAWSGVDAQLLRPEEPLPQPLSQPRGRSSADLPVLLPLYDHGPTRGRWLAGWAGGQAMLKKNEENREVIVVTTNGRTQAGGFNFNRHQPVDLAPWFAAPRASLELKLRLVARRPAAIEVELHSESAQSSAVLAVRPILDWQLASVPLSVFQPAGRPRALTGLFIRLLPEGAAELGAAWLARAVE